MPRRAHGEGSIYRRKDGRWQASLQLDGKRKVIYGKTRQEVAERLRQLQWEARSNGALPNPGTRTVNDLLDRWLEHASHTLKTRTAAEYRSLCNRHIRPHLGHVRLSRLDAQRVQSLYDRLLAAGHARTASYAHALLHRACEVAVLWGWLASNPCDRVIRPKHAAQRREVWTAEELAAFLDGTRDSWLHPLWTVAATTGCRISELAALQWKDLDLSGGALWVRRSLHRVAGEWITQAPKTRSGDRVIALPPVAVAALRQQRAQQAAWRLKAGAAWQELGLVFTNEKGGPLHQATVQHAMRRECDRLGLPRLTPHGLRHLSASLLLDRGLPLPAVSARLGHANPNITATIYSHAIKGQDQRAAEALQKALGVI